MTDKKLVKTDGRGTISANYMGSNREMSRTLWLEECFPEWGTFLNKHIENYKVPKGQVSLWWLGGSSWILKSDEDAIVLIDVFSGPSGYTQIENCGVCKQAGAESLDWLRLNPHVIDPWKFSRIDGVFCSHIHPDHCDIYTVKAALQTTDCMFYGSPVAAEAMRGWDVPEERLKVCKVGESVKLPGVEIEFLINYDETAIRTGAKGGALPYEEAVVSLLFKTSGGNILYLADTWYNDGYRVIGEYYDIDVAIFDMGWNTPGATDKMTPYDCVRLGQALKAKVMIPDHYDNLSLTAGDPALLLNQFERIAAENAPEIKTVILQCGAQFNYPQDQDIKRYSYPNQTEKFNIENSAKYGAMAKALKEKMQKSSTPE